MDTLDPGDVGRCDALFVTAHAEDVLLACPARIGLEAEKGRTAVVLALFEPLGSSGEAARCAESLGARYLAVGLSAGVESHPGTALGLTPDRTAEDDAVAMRAAHLLALAAPRTRAVNLFAPLGLTGSADGLVAYEASLRAFASEGGRNLYLYEERPEAFVPGAVRTRLALLGARLPPAAQRSPESSGLLRHLWSTNEPLRLRGREATLSSRLSRLVAARRRLRQASPWNPAKALGPRLQPIVHLGDEAAVRRVTAVAETLLPRDAKGRPRAAEVFIRRATAAAKRLGGASHAERFWLVLPSGEGLPETQRLEMAEA